MKRKFTTKTQEEISERDKRCVLCGTQYNLSRPHHIFFGAHYPDGEYDINGKWNGCILCQQSHNAFHHSGKFCNNKSLAENRENLEKIAQEKLKMIQ